MPLKGPAGNYAPLTLPDHVVQTMPTPIRSAWGDYLDVVAEWATAQRNAREARALADGAKGHDMEAAQAAVEAGKPIPAPTIEKKAAAAALAAREVEPRKVITRRAERVFLTVVEEHRDAWLTVANDRSLVAASEASKALDDVEVAILEAREAYALWSWLKYETRLDHAPRPGSAPSLKDVRGYVETELDPAHTERVVAAEEAEAAENARLRKVRGI